MAIDHGKLSRILETAIVAARLAGQRAMEEMAYTKIRKLHLKTVRNSSHKLIQSVKN
ncbi:MAG: hypothetical protein ACYTEE_11270 [Planctomycetota bacterium]|jgi:hypothetical protein